eukprot:g16253.t1
MFCFASNRQALKGSTTEQEDLEALFTVDTKGSFEGVSQASRRELARRKIFPEKPPKLGLTGSEEAKVERTLQRLANRREEPKKGPEVFDLWSMPTKAEQWKAEKDDEELGGFRIRKQPKPMPVHTPKTLHQQVSSAPAVLPAHEGQSVNPHNDAYEDLACMAAAKELEKEQEAKLLYRTQRPITAELKDALGDDAVNAMDEPTRIETYRKLFCADAPKQEEGETEEAYEKRIAKFKRKSQSQKNKERKRKFMDHKQAQLKAQRRLEKSVGEVSFILKDLKEEEHLQNERKAYRQAMRQQRKDLEVQNGIMDPTTRLGRGKAPEEDSRYRLSSILRRGLLPSKAESALEGRGRKKKSLKHPPVKVRLGGPVHRLSTADSEDSVTYAGFRETPVSDVLGIVFSKDERGLVPMTSNDVFVDLGCGHGEVLLAARSACLECRVLGVEMEPATYRRACEATANTDIEVLQADLDTCFTEPLKRMSDRNGLDPEWPADAELRAGNDVVYRLYKITELVKSRAHIASKELEDRFGLHWLQPPPGNYRPAKFEEAAEQKEGLMFKS